MDPNSVTEQSAPAPALEYRKEFPAPSYADWRAAVEAELKGAPFDKKMLTKTYEGITLQPIYRAEDTANLPQAKSFPGFAPFVRGAKASGYLAQPWTVTQEIPATSPAAFNAAARAALSRGLTGLILSLDVASRHGTDPDASCGCKIGQGGLSVATVEDFTQALAGIDLAKTPLFLRPGASALPVTALLAASLQQQNQPLANLQGVIETDPLGMLVRYGSLPMPLETAYQEMAQVTAWAAKNAPKLQSICAHGCVWHEAGASATQELAYTLATAVEYLRQLLARGLSINQAAPRVRFTLSVNSNLFMEIAKIRAARMLWATVVAALGGNAEAQKLAIHVATARFNKTVLDPYVNLLRGTVEAFAGAVGGCTSMQVGAFDEVIRTPDDFSQRIARNTQLILQKECDMDKVIDPAGGSWYVESLTDAVARQAWALFQDLEKRGGMAKAVLDNFPQSEVAKTAAEKQKALAQRRDVLVGTNQYANPKEKPLAQPEATSEAHERRKQLAAYRHGANEAQRLAALLPLAKGVKGNPIPACIKAALAGATLGELSRALRPGAAPLSAAPAAVTRLAVAYEKIRAAVECCAAGKGRPKVYLANLGPLAQHKARADFSRGFFSLGGFDIIYSKGLPTPEEAAQKAVESGAQIVVLCSTDDTYPQLVPPFVKALKGAAPERLVVLAGYPTEQIEAHKQAGVDDFVHVRVNAVEFLTNLLAKIGVTL